MTETTLSGAFPHTSDKPAPVWTKRHEQRLSDRAGSLNMHNESAVASDSRLPGQSKRIHKRRFITLTIVATLLLGFVLIAAWGMAHSDWLYGTYGGVRQADWDEIARLRTEMIRLSSAPGAIAALDDALLVPRPSKEDVIYDLQKAVLILQTGDAVEATRDLTTELRALINQLQQGFSPPSTVWPAPPAGFSESLFPQE